MKRPEQDLQKAICRFIDLAAPGLIYFHPANEVGRSSVRLGAIRKSIGVKPGIPDLVFVLPHGKAAFIEVKAGKGRLTEAQEAFRLLCDERGIPWALARSVADVEAILHGWLNGFGWTLKARAA
jgi:hypothetical protein